MAALGTAVVSATELSVTSQQHRTPHSAEAFMRWRPSLSRYLRQARTLSSSEARPLREYDLCFFEAVLEDPRAQSVQIGSVAEAYRTDPLLPIGRTV
ncbi:MAG: hypothetical protein OXN89_16370 [Bryobacterales bacterium]|nr:hypothetical protein [Bryobacterales bacterium]